MYIFMVKECKIILFKHGTFIVFSNLWLSRLKKVKLAKKKAIANSITIDIHAYYNG